MKKNFISCHAVLNYTQDNPKWSELQLSFISEKKKGTQYVTIHEKDSKFGYLIPTSKFVENEFTIKGDEQVDVLQKKLELVEEYLRKLAQEKGAWRVQSNIVVEHIKDVGWEVSVEDIFYATRDRVRIENLI